MLLLIGLATYTRIETAVAGNTQRQAQARQNALLGLQVALGQLQRFAGPDQRVTATAAAFPNVAGTAHYTGVWDSDPAATATPETPLTWLVSGNEVVKAGNETDPLAVKPAAAPTGATVELVGQKTSAVARDVVVPLVDITSAGVPGQAFVAGGASTAPIGRYGWWVGDQGVKAPVAVPDRIEQITYAPYNSAELRSRLRQQIALGASPIDRIGEPVFEPRDPNNAPLVEKDKVFASSQFAFLKDSKNSPIGPLSNRQHFHNWSPNNLAVLANSKLGGLRQDLSLKPDLLGQAFAAWAEYSNYTEDPVSPMEPTPIPAYTEDPKSVLRRRLTIQPPIPSSPGPGEITHKIAPVLSALLLNFNLQTTSSTGVHPLQARLRFIVGAWNPYTSGLIVPEELRLEIDGLPRNMQFVDASGVVLASVDLRATFGQTLVLRLESGASRADLNEQPDARSWLPGRVYYWTSVANTAPPNIGHFYRKNFVGFSADIVRPIGQTILASTSGSWRTTTETTLTLSLFKGNDELPLAKYESVVFPSFSCTEASASSTTAQFSFYFRLDQNKPVPDGSSVETWLISEGRDPRSVLLKKEAFVAGPDGPEPENYPGNPTTRLFNNDDLLLERAMAQSGRSYNEDVPVFELPRSPLVSIGQLQSLAIEGERPFMIGNPWGGANGNTFNDLFDRFFFSGLTPATSSLTPGQPLPNANLKVVGRGPSGNQVSFDEITNKGTTDGTSSKFLTQGSAFNFNSTSSSAWNGLLRSGRFIQPTSFTYLDSDELTGTAGDL
ncbi:MAG: hypothetical protein RIQ93_1763, partial [Verrucomicrobiota bacterium]